MNSNLITQVEKITSGVGQNPDFLDVLLLRSDQQRMQGVPLSPKEQHTLIEKQEELINQQKLFRTENQATREEEERYARRIAILDIMFTLTHNSIVPGSSTAQEIIMLAAEFEYDVNFLFSKLKPNAKEFFPQTSLS